MKNVKSQSVEAVNGLPVWPPFEVESGIDAVKGHSVGDQAVQKSELTMEEFIAFVREHARIEQHVEVAADATQLKQFADGEGGILTVGVVYHRGTICRVLTAPGLKVVYREFYEYPKHKPSLVNTWSWHPGDVCYEFQERAFSVVSRDGSRAYWEHELLDALERHTGIADFDLKATLGCDAVVEVDVDVWVGSPRLLVCEAAPDIRFSGDLIAECSDANSASTYWKELRLWRTSGGRYVAGVITRSVWAGQFPLQRAAVCDSPADVVAFFGDSVLAKRLYAAAGIELG